MKNRTGLIFVLSGPSGSGKTTLIKSLLKDKFLSKIFAKSISCTTRPKRPSEKEGRDYFFISKESFKALLKKKKIVEWTRYLDYYYGTPKGYLDRQLEKGNNIALCLDTKGAASIKKIYPRRAVTIFILPPQLQALRQRISLRSKGKREKDLEMRLGRAKKEISLAAKYDYRVVNDHFQSALQELRGIIKNEIDF